MKYKYKNYGPETLRPVIRIEISHNQRTVPYEVLIDSGADICIFDEDVAIILGINMVKGIRREVIGVTGIPQYYYLHAVSLNVGNVKYQTEVGFMKLSNQVFGIVGQKGFFDRFIVKFDLNKKEVELKERT